MAELRLGEKIVIPAIVVGTKEIKNQDKTITENGQYSADAGYTGLGKVTVNVPGIEPTGTISITQNGNYDVTEYANANVNISIPNYIAPKNNVNGVYKADDTATSFNLNGSTDVYDHALAYAFYRCYKLTSADLSSLTTIGGDYAMEGCFSGCTHLTTVDLSSLRSVGGKYAMQSCFNDCSSLTSVNLSSLKWINTTSALSSCFSSCSNLISVNLSSLTTIGGDNAMESCFYGCSSLTSVDLSSLNTISGEQAMRICFMGCTSLTNIYFHALQSFGTETAIVNQFERMLSDVTGCTLHFPSNMQSEVERRTGYPNFGGTNTVVLFDLPPTA